MTTIFFTSFYGFISRNVFATGLLEHLLQQPEVRVVILVPFYKKAFFEQYFAADNVLIEPVNTSLVVNSRVNRLFARLFGVLLRTFTIEYRTKERLAANRTVAGMSIYACSRAITALFGRSRAAHTMARHLEYRICSKGSLRSYFEKHAPACVFATDLFHDMDAALLREARSLGVTTIGMVRSWDNNTTRGLCRVLPDWAVVNNPLIADELVQLQSMRRSRVFVGGIPQFDRYITGKRASRNELFGRLKREPSKRLILFAPAGAQLSDTDGQVLELLRQAVDDRRLPGDLQFLVRMHPGCPAALDRFSGDPLFYIEAPGVQFAERPKDTELTPQDAEHLGDSLLHSEIVIHVSSSIGLDAVVFDKPQIMIEFDGQATRPYLSSIRRYHDEDHMRLFIETGVARIAKSPEELISSINLYLEDPSLDSAGRERGRQQQCWLLDGRSGERIGQFVLERLNLGAEATSDSAQMPASSVLGG